MKWHIIKIGKLNLRYKFGRYRLGYRKFCGWGDFSVGVLLIRWFFTSTHHCTRQVTLAGELL